MTMNMQEIMNVLFVCVFFFEMLISVIFFSNIAQKKNSLYAILLAGALIFEAGALINIFVFSTSWFNVTFSVLANIIVCLIFFRIKPIKAIFYSVLLVSVSTFLEHIIVFLISSFSNLYLTEYKSETILLVIEIIMSKLLYFLIVMILLRFTHKDESIIKVPVAFYLFPSITLISVICFWYISLNQQLELKNQTILGIVSILLLLATLFVYFSFQTHAQKENKMLILQQAQDKIKTDITYYDILEKQNNNLRTYAHDAKNHLTAIQNLNNDPKIADYISQLLECLADYSNVCHSGNKILDVIINKYVTECRLKEVIFEFDIKNNNLIGLEYYDTVTILTNLLDNAVEASLHSSNKYISIETDYRNNFSIIIITNSCDVAPEFDSALIPKTTKENKALHGFGIKSVKKTLKKYNGDIAFEYDSDNKFFSATIMFEAQSI